VTGQRFSVIIFVWIYRHFHAGAAMAQRCELCGKGPHYGNVVSHANNRRRRRWNANLRRVRAIVAGVRKHVRVCTACLRSGRVQKAA
jgi:large subunit ribosomal protein L28